MNWLIRQIAKVTLIGKIENEEASSLAKKGLDELKLAYSSLYEQN